MSVHVASWANGVGNARMDEPVAEGELADAMVIGLKRVRPNSRRS